MVVLSHGGLKPSFHINEMSSKYDDKSTAATTKMLLELNTEFEGASYRVVVNEYEGDELMYVLDFGNSDISDERMAEYADDCVRVMFDKVLYRKTVITPVNPEQRIESTHCVACIAVAINYEHTSCTANEKEMMRRIASIYEQVIKANGYLIYTGCSMGTKPEYKDDYDLANEN